MCNNNSEKCGLGSGEERTCPCEQSSAQPNVSKDIGPYMNLSVSTVVDSLPVEMTFNEESLMTVVGYSILCLIATVGNVTVFWTLWRYRYRSRVTLFLMHLSVADLIVALIYMPLEIIWKATVSWEAGDFACRVMMFFRAFGFYLSSFILVAISLDRYFAVAKPLSLQIADRRGNIMLIAAWVFSIVASVPQVSTVLQVCRWSTIPTRPLFTLSSVLYSNQCHLFSDFSLMFIGGHNLAELCFFWAYFVFPTILWKCNCITLHCLDQLRLISDI